MQRTITKLFISIFTILGALSINAQDLGVSSLMPVDGSTMNRGVRNSISVYIKNFGNSDITSGQQFTLVLQAANIAPSNLPLQFNQTIAPGDSAMIPVTYSFRDTMTPRMIKFCAYTITSGDPDNSNDTTCRMYDLVEYRRDVGISSISPGNGHTVVAGEQIPVTLVFNNFGSETVQAGLTVPVVLVVGNGTPQALNLTLNNEIQGNSSRNINLNLTINDNAAKGDLQICFVTALPEGVDSVITNNGTCVTWNNITGVEENIFGAFKMYPNPARDNLTFQYDLTKNSQVDIELINTSGQVVKSLFSGQQSAGLNIFTSPVNDLPAGVYIYRMRSDVGMKTGKIVIH